MIAILDESGNILGIYPKPSPFHIIPAGGRMLPMEEPTFDHEIYDANLPSQVPADATEVRFLLTRKPDAEVAKILTARLTDAIQKHLDARAKERNYDGIMSAASYALSSHPRFGPEGQAYLHWRDACWDYGYQVLADVEAGKRQIPDAQTLVSELPQLILPS